jgi:hypothetical protein
VAERAVETVRRSAATSPARHAPRTDPGVR